MTTNSATPRVSTRVAVPERAKRDEGRPTTGALFRFATAGSVDDGKSTLVGRLLHDAKAILADQLDQVAATSRARGFAHGAFDFALLTDGLRAEREQGITIDVAYRYFATDRRSFILADCPGHVQYTRNMVTGAATADAVIVLVDARKGVVEQTRRHLAVASLLRVEHVIVAVNKIDLTGFDEQTYTGIELEALRVADELGIRAVRVLPVSALEGDNIVDRSARTPWYRGETLFELLETLPVGAAVDEPLRLPVQLVLRPQGGLSPDTPADQVERLRDFRGFAGRIAAGAVTVGDRVQVLPSGRATEVTGVHVAGVDTGTAAVRQSVTLTLADEIDAARGALIVAEGSAPRLRRDAVVELFQLDPRATAAGARVLVKHGTATVQAIVAEVLTRRDLETLAHGDIGAEGSLAENEIGRVRLRLASDLPLETYARSREGGSLLLIHPADGATLAAGTVID